MVVEGVARELLGVEDGQERSDGVPDSIDCGMLVDGMIQGRRVTYRSRWLSEPTFLPSQSLMSRFRFVEVNRELECYRVVTAGKCDNIRKLLRIQVCA